MTTHYIVAAVLVVLLFVVTMGNHPGMMMPAMPNSVHMTLLILAAVLVAVYAGLVLTERADDEREEAHRSTAGRIGFIVGIVTLAFALLFQGLSHAIDPWVPAALCAMIVAKVAARAAAARRG
ncbi:MAG TPA: hypothetical protein VF439_03090 [Candidatus Paceibacterota bacterium]